MKIPVKSVISKTDVNKLRKKRQVKAKKTAFLRKNFRRLNESSSTDKVQQDLLDAVSRVQRIAKHFQATILKEFGISDIQLVKRTNTKNLSFDRLFHFRSFDSHVQVNSRYDRRHRKGKASPNRKVSGL
ncbi:hypothetical protein DYB32_010543 [Aphanomyces invadans]|uniref:Uncharacterized protein n=1 Tax=Aphanomyces invadans TaxID=157072 RepID=A0A3R6VP25_9STRA|nr:hypothetical protein DYB32_010543 [Aphanomyces invadans]